MISTNLERLQASNERINTNIVNAYIKAEEKEATLPDVQNSENLAETIENIPQSASGWQPQDDWWDVDKILAEDTEDYPAKMIWLLNDGTSPVTFNITSATKIAKIKTSDGAQYTATATHTWDRTKDKACSLGYKTRYFIFYFTDTNVTLPVSVVSFGSTSYSSLYVILQDVALICPSEGNYGTSCFGNTRNRLFENIKQNNSTITLNCRNCFKYNSNLKEINNNIIFRDYHSGDNAFFECASLKKVNLLNVFPGNCNCMFKNCFALEELILEDTSNVSLFTYFLNNCYSLKHISKLDFNSATDITHMFTNCCSLVEIGEVKNIKISGLSFSDCKLLNHDTLVRILNALYDYSEDTENVHKITLGATNLEKLTDEELAIGQNKGWTIS